MHEYSTNRLYWRGLGRCDRAQHADCEGLDSCQEMRDEGTSLSGLCCVGRIVPSQFLEASVKVEGSALHKLVGDLINSHRLLSLFVVVSPVLQGEKVAVLASQGSPGQWMENWVLPGPVRALTWILENTHDLEQSRTAQA